MVAEHFEEFFPQEIKEKFYDSFIALRHGDVNLPVDVIGVIAKHYAMQPSLNVEYSYFLE